MAGNGGLTPALSRDQFDAILDAALDAVPHVRGVNNHMIPERAALFPLAAGRGPG